MTRKQRRLTMIGGSLAVLAIAAALVLNAMRDSIVFFSTPTMAAEKQMQPGKRFRLGGLVQPGSLVKGDNLAVHLASPTAAPRCRWSTRGSCRICSAKGRASSPRVRWMLPACSGRIRCWPSMTRPTCPRMSQDALKKQGHWKDDYGAKPNIKPDIKSGAAASAAPTLGVAK